MSSISASVYSLSGTRALKVPNLSCLLPPTCQRVHLGTEQVRVWPILCVHLLVSTHLSVS